MMIGCQFSLYPMAGNYIDIILTAIRDLKHQKEIRMETDDISTMLTGPADYIFRLVEKYFLSASKNCEHLVLNATFSHGCPGEPEKPYCCSENLKESGNKKIVSRKLSGILASAQFALYPLNDSNYMNIIYNEIEAAKKFVYVTPKHYCTRMDADIDDIFFALKNAFNNVCKKTHHVVMTVTISKKGNI